LTGVFVSLVAGSAVYVAVGELEGKAEQLTEGIIALVAVAVLTWMIFWIRRQARSIGGELRGQVDQALAGGTVFGLATIVFVGVVREGLETALFLLAVIFDSGAASTAIGAFAGLALAIVLGYGLYRGGQQINVRLFFQVTGGLIIIVAAGLLSKGVHELQEAGVIGTFQEHVWNISGNPVFGHGTLFDFLKGLFGWSAAPSVEQVAVWALYLIAASWIFYLDGRLPFGLSQRLSPGQSLSSQSPGQAVAAEAEIEPD
ncbi:MAG: FTR1 family protein, partial [Chloroflexi bacterium]|nr:FTR1 family protein [Chloroflexota bacterium]